MKLANNTVIDYYRSATSSMTNNFPENLPSKEFNDNRLTYKLAETYLREAIDDLPVIYKEALILSELKDVSQIKLAAELGISYSGLKSRVQRAKKMLRDEIVRCCDYKFDKYGNVISCCGSDCC